MLIVQSRGPRKSRTIPLLILRVFISYKKDENLPDSAVFKAPDLVGIVDFFFFFLTP